VTTEEADADVAEEGVTVTRGLVDELFNTDCVTIVLADGDIL
jgi:hypothetical protein